jgi:hypothetical protein
VIQADFLTTSNRQSVDEDSDWNKNIANMIPFAFETDIKCFNHGAEPYLIRLANLWPLYFDSRTSGLSQFWRDIKTNIRNHLTDAFVVKSRAGSIEKPRNLMFMAWAHDRNGDPLFGQKCDYVSA